MKPHPNPSEEPWYPVEDECLPKTYRPNVGWGEYACAGDWYNDIARDYLALHERVRELEEVIQGFVDYANDRNILGGTFCELIEKAEKSLTSQGEKEVEGE